MWQQILRKQQRDQWLQLIWGAQAYLRLSKIDFSSLSGSLHNPYKIRPTTNWKTAIIADFGLGRAPSVIFECCYFFNFHFVFLYILHFRISIDQGYWPSLHDLALLVQVWYVQESHDGNRWLQVYTWPRLQPRRNILRGRCSYVNQGVLCTVCAIWLDTAGRWPYRSVSGDTRQQRFYVVYSHTPRS